MALSGSSFTPEGHLYSHGGYSVRHTGQNRNGWQSLVGDRFGQTIIIDAGQSVASQASRSTIHPENDQGLTWDVMAVSATSGKDKGVINYDVQEGNSGKTMVKQLIQATTSYTTSALSFSPSSSPDFISYRHSHDTIDSSPANLINSSWSLNFSDSTAMPEAETYNVPRLSAEIQVALYSIIFSTALVGNLLIIITLIQNKRMRTVTNVFLLNLAVSDLLLALVCMPFTLVPVLLMDFIFGAFMCVFIRYLQGKCLLVAVSLHTLP
ncbi:cholecystokinin receptor type a [Plakobranchus ocellatus]|uniref:Cholecystokinin receptor type a n=1 Tax=Plakobranchus ocellatus TaxID=259542 RepID=A0AAV4ATK0_9GAST|nr:cholecystokinin receptor type a [Plakobranchus ocellatus]